MRAHARYCWLGLVDEQARIVAARATFGADTWRFRLSDTSRKQRFQLYFTVTFAKMDEDALVTVIPKPPPVLPELPQDLFYPFYLGATSAVRPHVALLVAVVSAAIVTA